MTFYSFFIPDVVTSFRSSFSPCSPDAKTYIKACVTLCQILECIPMDEFETFAGLYVSVVSLADERVFDNNSPPEDLKAACVEAAYNLVKYSTCTVIEEALQDDLFAGGALPHAISVFLNLSSKEPSKSLKISALKALEIVLIRSTGLLEAKKISPASLASTYCKFLPGVAMASMKIITGDDKHPQGLLVCVLSVLSHQITLSFPQMENDASASPNLTKLRTVMGNIIPRVITHRSIDVQLALLSLVKSIFETASQQVLDHLDVVLLEVPLTFCMESKNDALQRNAMTFLCDVTREEGKHRQRVCDIIKDKAITILLNAPNTVDIDTESMYMSNIQLLSAIFTLMYKYNRLNDFMCTPSHRNRLMYFLSTYSALQPVDPTGDTCFDGNVAWKVLYSKEHNTYNAMCKLLSIIGSNCSIDVVTDFIVDFLQESNCEASCIFCSNFIVHSALTQCNLVEENELKQSVTNGLDEKLQELAWYYFENCTQVVEDSISSVTSSTNNTTSSYNLQANTSSISKKKATLVLSLPSSSSSSPSSPSSSSSTGLWSKSFYKIYFALQGLLFSMVHDATAREEMQRKYFNPLDKKGDKKEQITLFLLTLLRVLSLANKLTAAKVITDLAQSVLGKFAQANNEASIESLLEKHLTDIISHIEYQVSTNPYTDVSSLLFVLSSRCNWSHVPLYKCLLDRLLEILDANYTQDASNLLKALLVLAKWMKQAKEEKMKLAANNEQKVIHQNCKCTQAFTCTCCKDLPKEIASTCNCSASSAFDQIHPKKSDCKEHEGRFQTNWRNFIHDWYRSEFFEDEDEASSSQSTNVSREKNGQEEKMFRGGEVDDDEEEAKDKSHLEREEDLGKSRETSIEVLMTKDILTRCVNLLGTPEAYDRIVNLEVIEIISIVLAWSGEEGENLLLPLVHKAWPQLVIRLTDEASVARVALRVLICLSSVCGDFIKDRVVSQVIPKIVSFLKVHLDDGCKKETKIGHRYTMVFQYQLQALENVAKLALNLPLFGKSLWPVIEITLKYTSHQQLKELREAALKAIELFQQMDPDAVWFYQNT